MKVIDNPWNQPDVSEVTPVYVPDCGTRSYTMGIVFLKDGSYSEPSSKTTTLPFISLSRDRSILGRL